ncbi:MAG: tetratricopeptide repeat protein [Deltaproteobacteria bacterium]|nr:MAG: tetratricopeptide repeat protein [Deltaproteobacteria bacterium]
MSHNGGLNFYLGNNPGWRETMFLRPGLPFRKLVLEAEPHRRSVDERNAWWWQRAKREIADKPVVWASVLLTKAIWSVNNREIPRNEDYRCRIDDGPLRWIGALPVRYGLVLPWALVGAALLVRRGRDGARVLPATWLALHLPVIAFIVADRYRLATWPVMCACAAVALAAIGPTWRAWKARRQRPSAAWLLLAGGLVAWVPIDPRTAKDPAWCLHVDGNLALMEGDPDTAAQLYRQALALDPEDWGARDFLARTLFREGDLDGAAALMEPLVAWFPDHYPTLYFMARLEERRGNLDAAADYMGRAYRVPGDRTNTGVRYVRLLVEAGRRDEAAAVLRADPALARHPKLAGILR